MERAQNPRLAYVAEQRRTFAERRTDFYKGHAERGLIEEVDTAIAERKAPPVSLLRKYLTIGNERARKVLAGYEAKFGRLEDPKPGEYDQGCKECVDTRPTTSLITDFMLRAKIHERTAASIVRSGNVFLVLNDNGVGFVNVHYNCGGIEDVARPYHLGQMPEENKTPDVRRIAEAIPSGIAIIHNEKLSREENIRIRAEANASLQTNVGANIVGSNELGNSVYPLLVTWQNWPEVDVRWLSLSQTREHAWVTEMRENLRMQWGIASELGRDPKRQFAHNIYYYDPYRLGRVNDPRNFFDNLPNGGFCVTESFGAIMHGEPISPSALASLRYAAFMNGGHVAGIGGKDGNRHIVVIDPDPEVTMRVEQALLATNGEIRDLTRNGETITQVQYNLQTREIMFLD